MKSSRASADRHIARTLAQIQSQLAVITRCCNAASKSGLTRSTKLNAVIDKIADYYGVTPSSVVAGQHFSRRGTPSRARRMVWKAAMDITGITGCEVAALMGFNPGAVYYGYKMAHHDIATYPPIADEWEAIRRLLE